MNVKLKKAANHGNCLLLHHEPFCIWGTSERKTKMAGMNSIVIHPQVEKNQKENARYWRKDYAG
jgi:hypothetical protein